MDGGSMKIIPGPIPISAPKALGNEQENSQGIVDIARTIPGLDYYHASHCHNNVNRWSKAPMNKIGFKSDIWHEEA